MDGIFSYQSVSLDSQLLFFDDVKKNFDFESLFSVLTQGLTVEKKNQPSFHLSFEDSPKIVITTNYVIPGDNESHVARKHEIEFSDYYNAAYTPFDDFGHLLIDDWNKEEMNRFYNFMIYTCQLYIQKGLLQYTQKNLKEKKLQQATCEEFMEFVEDWDKNKQYVKSTEMERFQEEYPDYSLKKGRYKLSQKRFTIWLKKYAQYNNLELVEERQYVNDNNIQRRVSCFLLADSNYKKSENNEKEPF